MKEYHKIETLLDRDDKFKAVEGKWRLPEFEYLKNNTWLWTEKIDGTNVRVMWIPEVGIKFGGKTDNAQMPPFLLRQLEAMFTATNMKIAFPDTPACLYGEGFGAKIQGGGKYIPNGCDFILFDVKVGDWWLKREDVEDVANKLDIKTVPIIGKGTLQDAIAKVRNGYNSTFGGFNAEGVVVKPLIELFTRKGERLVGKIKSKDF